MTAKAQSGVKSLSERAQSILHRLLDQQVAPPSIAQAVWLHTRENVTPAAITRYASRYRQRKQEQQRAREKVDGFITQVHREGISISDLLRAALLEKLSSARRDRTLGKLDLLKLEAAERLRSGFELRQQQAQVSAEFRERELQLKGRHIRLAEHRFQLDRAKAQAVLDRLGRKAGAGKRFSHDDMRQIHELYGLYQNAASPNDNRETEPNHANAR